MPRKMSPWQGALRVSADPERARRFFDLLSGTSAQPLLERASAAQIKLLTALFAGSQALSSLLVTHPDWLELLEPAALQFPRRKHGMSQQLESALASLLRGANWAAALAALRQFKQRELMRIGARDLARLAAAPEITRELSDLADVCLETVWRLSYSQLAQRYGRP